MEMKTTDKNLENVQLSWILQRIKMKEAITSYHDELMFETHELINPSLKIDEGLMLNILRRLVDMNAITEVYTLTKDKRLNSSEDLLIFDTDSMFKNIYQTYESDSDFVSREAMGKVINDPDTYRHQITNLIFDEPTSSIKIGNDEKTYLLPDLEKALIIAFLELSLKKDSHTDWQEVSHKMDMFALDRNSLKEKERIRNLIHRINLHIYEKLHITNKTCFIWDEGIITPRITITLAK